MDRIRHGKLPKSLRLQLQQLLPTMIHGPAHPPILPPRMLHILQLIQRLAHILPAPSLRRKRSRALYPGARRHEFALKLENGLGDLRLHFCAHAGETQKDAIKDAAGGGVEVRGGADEAAAFELVEEFAGPAEEEEYEDNVAKTVFSLSALLLMASPGTIFGALSHEAAAKPCEA